MSKASDEFHDHRDQCSKCEDIYNLCPIGVMLLAVANNEVERDLKKGKGEKNGSK